MLSYLNDPAVKALYVERFAEHRRLDEVVQGQGYDNGRGCFVGCTLNGYDHSRFPIELGWPEWLARLADYIFEGIPKDEAPQFGTDLLDAVPVGVDLEPIRYRFLLTVQRRNLARLEGNMEPYAVQVRAAIEQVIAYLQDPSNESAARSAWSAAWSAESAWSAAWSAARSAAESARSAARLAARSAARLAAESAEWSAESAWSAWSAAWSAVESARSARSATRSAAESAAEYRLQRDDLLALIRESGAA